MSNPEGINQCTKGGAKKLSPERIKRFEADTRQAQFMADQRLMKRAAGNSAPGGMSSSAWKRMNKPFGPNNPPAGVSKSEWKKSLKLPA